MCVCINRVARVTCYVTIRYYDQPPSADSSKLSLLLVLGKVVRLVDHRPVSPYVGMTRDVLPRIDVVVNIIAWE